MAKDKPKIKMVVMHAEFEEGTGSIASAPATVQINGVDRPDVETLDEALAIVAEAMWGEHPNNPKNKVQ